jgi:branched-chain amino acid transport system substrate-binding protein
LRSLFSKSVASIALGALLLTSVPARAAEPYNIDVVLSLSGPGTFIGKAEEQTFTILEQLVNRQGGIHGQPVHFVLHDDQTSPANAVQFMGEIVAKKVPGVLGSTLAATCQAMAPLAKNGPVEYCLSPAIHPAKGSYVFSASVSTHDFAVGFYRYFRARGLKRFALITSTDASGQDADNEFANALQLPENKGSGLTMVSHEHFNVTDLSVAAQMANIKAAKPDVVICYAAGTPFGTLLRGVQQAGIDVPIATGNANMIYAEMKQYAEFLPKELLFPGIPVLAGVAPNAKARAVQQQFLDAYRAAGIKPDLLSTMAWDPSTILIDALRKYGTNATPDQVKAYIENLHDWVGVTGRYDFRDGSQRGLGVDNLMVMRWDRDKQTWVAVSDLGGNVSRKAR